MYVLLLHKHRGTIMGFGGPKLPDNSAQEARLKDQEKKAKREEERQRDLRVSSQRAAQRRSSGRSSLIKSGSELGTANTLG